MEEAYEMGTVEFVLDGEKLKGGFALVRIGDKKAKDYGKNWLLIKMNDDFADRRKKPVKSQPESVKSGKTIEEVKDGKKPHKK